MTTDKSIRNAIWLPEVWKLRESESKHGKWALRMGEATIRFFPHKCDAEAFWDDARDASHTGETVAY